MRGSHYQQWKVLLSYIWYLLRNLKDLKSHTPFLQDEAGPRERGESAHSVGQEKKKGEPPKGDCWMTVEEVKRCLAPSCGLGVFLGV